MKGRVTPGITHERNPRMRARIRRSLMVAFLWLALESPSAHGDEVSDLANMGVETESVVNVGGFTSWQKKFLDFHRNSVLLMSSGRR